MKFSVGHNTLPAVLGILLFGGCIGEKQGTVGVVATCSTGLAGYENSQRLAVSPVTLVDTDVESPVIQSASGCCLSDIGYDDDSFIQPLPLSDDRAIRSLSTIAARYPWGGYCHDEAKSDCDTCNYCPYGVQALQGAWIDEGPPSDASTEAFFWGIGDPAFGDVSNRVEFDGNTFRWRYKNRATGDWADYRGFYYCVDAAAGWFVSTQIVRGHGRRCANRYPMRDWPANPEERYPDWGVGDAIQTGMSAPVGFGHEGAWPVITMFLDVPDPPFPGAFKYEVLCHPGEIIGGDQKCPDESSFFDCWDAPEDAD